MLLDSVSDVGSHNVPVEGNDQLSWVIGIVSIRDLDSSGPNGHGVDINHHKNEIKGTDQVVPVVLVPAHGLNRELELLVQVILVCWINRDHRLVNGIRIDRILINTQQKVVVHVEIYCCSVR